MSQSVVLERCVEIGFVALEHYRPWVEIKIRSAGSCYACQPAPEAVVPELSMLLLLGSGGEAMLTPALTVRLTVLGIGR